MFKAANSNDDIIKAFCVRSIVFIGEQKCPYEIEMDGLDYSSLHIIGEIGSEPFACGRIRFLNGYAKLERIAVRKKWRKKGFGKKLVKFMILKSEEAGFFKFKIHAQAQAVLFYENLGFKTYDEPFTEAGILHRKMEKISR